MNKFSRLFFISVWIVLSGCSTQIFVKEKVNIPIFFEETNQYLADADISISGSQGCVRGYHYEIRVTFAKNKIEVIYIHLQPIRIDYNHYAGGVIKQTGEIPLERFRKFWLEFQSLNPISFEESYSYGRSTGDFHGYVEIKYTINNESFYKKIFVEVPSMWNYMDIQYCLESIKDENLRRFFEMMLSIRFIATGYAEFR